MIDEVKSEIDGRTANETPIIIITMMEPGATPILTESECCGADLLVDSLALRCKGCGRICQGKEDY